MPVQDIIFRFLGDSRNLQAAARRAERQLTRTQRAYKKVADTIGVLRSTARFLGPALAGRELIQGVKLAEALGSQYAATAQIIEDTGGAANVTTEQVKKLAREMSLATGIPKETLLRAQNILLTFKEIRNVVGEGNQIFDRATRLTADMAAVFGGSAADAAKQLGKALNDPITGVSALTRVGVTFTQQQKEQIRTLVETGQILEAQKLILAEIESQVAGVAESSADATERIARSWDVIQEAIGTALLPFIEDLAPKATAAANDFARGVTGINTELGKLELARLAQQLDVVGRVLGRYADGLTDVQAAHQAGLFAAKRFLDELEAGREPVKALANAIADLTVSGKLNQQSLATLQKTVKVTDTEMRNALDTVEVFADAYGLTDDQLRKIQVTLRAQAEALSVQEIQARRAADMAEMLGRRWEETNRDLDEAADASRDLRAAQRELADEIRATLDPLFAAERATDRYTEALRRAQQDGRLTQEEIEQVTEAWVDMQAKVAALDPGQIETFAQAAQQALGLTDQAARRAAQGLAALSQIDASGAVGALSQLVARLEQVTQRPITIDFSNVRFASDAEIEQTITRVLLSMQRRGTIRPIML